MIYHGKCISPGVAEGVAQLVDARAMLSDALGVEPRGNPPSERERLLAAVGRALVQLDRLRRQLDRRVATHDIAIFESHASILRDSKFIEQIENEILRHQQAAEAAVARVVSQMYATFASSTLPLVHDKAADLLDIGRRLLECLSSSAAVDEDHAHAIVVASMVTPSELVRLVHQGVEAIVTEVCGSKSHTAILARGLGIPLVSGIAVSGNVISRQTPILVDAAAGLVVVAPTRRERQTVAAIREKIQTVVPADETPPAPAVTADGMPVTVLLNISDHSEAEAVPRLGAAGIGLFRTEFLYMDRAWWPTDDECYADYRRVVDAMGPGELHLRLADFGAEKCPPYADIPLNRNPSLGLRGMRLLLQREDILRPQLQAVLRLASERPLTVLIPMLDTLDTLDATVHKLCELAGRRQQSQLPFQLGAMVELPSAALSIEDILPRVDSVAIGLNDLTQYLLAADRDDELVEGYHDAMQPPVLRLLHRVVQAADAFGKPVTICGELAGDPRLTGLLLALGVRRMSVARGSYRPVIEAIHGLNLQRLGALGHEAVRLTSGRAIRDFVMHRLHGEPLAGGEGPSDSSPSD